jgi:peptide/nickel transport system substrate-binding protein
MKKLTIYLLMVVFLVILTGTFSLASSEKEVVYVIDPASQGAKVLNPLKMDWATPAIKLIYEALIKQGVDGKFYPCLASSWEISDDGMTWTFNLKKGVKFHDGSEFNADVVKWFFKEMRESPSSSYMVQPIKSVTVEDPYTVTLHMEYPDPNLLYNLSSTYMDIPSKEAIEKYGDDFGIKYAVGTGPFMLDEWIMDDRVILKKNPDYKWGTVLSENKGPAKIDRVVMREIKEETTVFMELKSGGVDIVEGVPAIFLEKIKEDKNIYVMQIPSARLIYFGMNVQKEPYTDIKVREAICLAINQEEILEHVFMNVGKAAHTYLIDQLEESKVPEEYKIRYNLDKAKEIMAEVGWKDTDGDGILEKGGEKFVANLWVENVSIYRKTAEVVQGQLRKLGIDTKITQFDTITYHDRLKKGNQELFIDLYGWGNANILEYYFNSKRIGSWNFSMWDVEKSDELLDKAMTKALTWEERVEYFTDYHKYLLKQFPWAPIYLPPVNIAIRSNVIMPKKVTSAYFESPTFLDLDIIDVK